MPKGTTSFTKPPVEVISSMNRQLTPEQQAQKDMMDQIKTGGRPVGGVPPVKIPPLDAEPLKTGGSMSQQATILSDPRSPLSPAYSPELAQMAAKQGGPFAVLPESATQDPGFIPGVGSRIAANQPQLRGQPDQRKPILREETISDLEKLASFQKTAESIQQKELEAAEAAEAKKAEEDVAAGPLPFQAEMGIVDGEDWNVLNNPARRKEIEDRLRPLGIEDIIMYGEIQQEVEVVPGKTSYKFRSTTGEEDLAVKRMMFGESGGDRYMLDKFSLYNLALGIVSINNMALPTHLNDKKRFDETLFLKKYETLMRFPVQLLADMAVQYMWFDQRVRRLFVRSAEELKKS